MSGGVWCGQTSDERRSQRRAKLIAAALHLYGQSGYHGSSVRAVCQEAGLTERYFYESFVNREKLLEAAFEQAVSSMEQRIRDADDVDMVPALRLRAMLGAYYLRLKQAPAEARVFLFEITGVSVVIDKAIEESLFRLTDPLMAVLDPQQRGPLSRSSLARRGMSGGLLHVAIGWIESEYYETLDEVIDTAVLLCKLAEPVVCKQSV